MKKIISVLVFLAIQWSAFTQAPVLDSANIVHKDGDSIFSWNGRIDFYAPGNSGANVFWDFSAINFTIPDTNVNQLFYIFVFSDPPVYRPGGCNLVYFSMSPVGNEIKTYFYADINKLELMGDETTPVFDNKYFPPKCILKFPFTYLSEFSDSTNSHNVFSPSYISGISNTKSYYSVLADGWGSLKILNITHTNVLRVRTISHWTDTSDYYVYNGAPPVTSYGYGADTVYQWYTPNTYEPLMSMGTTWQDSSGVWINHKGGYITPYGLNFLNMYMGIKETNVSQNFTISPNPASGKITIDLQGNKNFHNTIISIYDIMGQLILQQSLKVQKTELNIASYAKGVYIVKVNNDKYSMESKFVKE